jgi:hypothetical protein
MPNSPKKAYDRNKNLRRLKPKTIRQYKSKFVEQYNYLIDGFTREEYVEYERIYVLFAKSKPEVLLNYVNMHGYTGIILEMAQLRANDRIAHQRVIGRVRHRWTNLYAYQVDKMNDDANQLWIKIARSVQKNSKGREDKKIYNEWEGKEGLPKLVQFLKELYEKQDGKCAITGEKMVLAIDSNKRVTKEKCSVDRKYSTKGYTPDNIWLVSYWVNVMKSDMTLKEFWGKAKIIADAYHSRDLKNK